MYTVNAAKYSLEITENHISVIIDGVAFAVLNVSSGVNSLDENYEPVADFDEKVPALVSVTEDGAEKTFVWKTKSNLWDEKTYTLICDPLRFRYFVSVKGSGKVDSVNYFNGAVGEKAENSYYEFQDGFFPCVSYYNKEDYYFKASVGCHRWGVFMIPPMFCYAFRCEGLSRRLGLGLVAERGEHNFHSFDYNTFGGTFNLSVEQHGHTNVCGQWTAPSIIGYGAEDEFDVCRKYSEYYVTCGIAKPRKAHIPPKFWHGPMACGWIEQFARDDVPYSAVDRSREPLYREYLDRLHKAGLYPRCLIIDDKWQKEYATDFVDTEKWSDLRAFTDEQHANGIHTLLWFKIFDPEGLTEGVIDADMSGGEIDPPAKKIDPSHPAFLKILDDALYRMISSDEGCYNCDGIKIDYAFMNPIGRKFETYSGKYGAELLYDYMEHIYNTVKKIKPEAIINASACHPYFAHMLDHARLHDYDGGNRFCREDLAMRAKMFRIAAPLALIDTDNGGYTSHRDTMRCMTEQMETGIPDIYGVSPFGKFSFTDEDLAAIAKIWREYTARIDAMYE